MPHIIDIKGNPITLPADDPAEAGFAAFEIFAGQVQGILFPLGYNTNSHGLFALIRPARMILRFAASGPPGRRGGLLFMAPEF